MGDTAAHNQPSDDRLDPRVERELAQRLAAIKRQTNAGWHEISFWSWLVERLTFQSRRQKK